MRWGFEVNAAAPRALEVAYCSRTDFASQLEKNSLCVCVCLEEYTVYIHHSLRVSLSLADKFSAFRAAMKRPLVTRGEKKAQAVNYSGVERGAPGCWCNNAPLMKSV